MQKVIERPLGPTGLAFVRDLAFWGKKRLALHPQSRVLGQAGDRCVGPYCC